MSFLRKLFGGGASGGPKGAQRPGVAAARNLAAMSLLEIHSVILSEMSLPAWILEPLEPPLIEIGCSPEKLDFADFTGAYTYLQIQTSDRRIALVYVEGDIVAASFKSVANFAGCLTHRDWDVLFIFTNATAIPGALLEQRNTWVTRGRRITFCQKPDIERLLTPADPGSRKAVLRGWFGIDQAVTPAAWQSASPLVLANDARTLLIGALARASEKQLVPAGYFDRLLDISVPSGNWVSPLKMSFSSSSDQNARLLVEAAAAQGSHGAPMGYTVLGWILEKALHTLPRYEQAIVVSVMVTCNLLTGADEIKYLSVRYQVPGHAIGVPVARDLGPDFTFTDPGELELQNYEKPPPLLKLADLPKCLEQQGAVCLIAVGSILGRTGTGFLVAPDLVLTNCHVLLRDWRMEENRQPAEIERNAPSVELRFRYTAAEKDAAEKGRTFSLVKDRPVVKYSTVPKLDYVLLRVVEEIKSDRGLGPASFTTAVPPTHSALHIVQHPQGQVMQVDFNTNGVTHVSEDKGLLQYITRTAEGSSGSPCFNEQWEVVGLHHAERTKYNLWSIREGILFRSILDEIKTELKGA